MTASPCSRCETWPKHPSSNRYCYWCKLWNEPIAVQFEVRQARLQRAEGENIERIPRRVWPRGMRWCSGCKSIVAICYCPKNASRCRACVSAANHGARIAKLYDLSPSDYQALLAFQGGLCAICGMRPKNINLHVDHSHKTQKVRGLLCKSCNHDLLKAAHHDAEILRRAADYLDNPPWERMGND